MFAETALPPATSLTTYRTCSLCLNTATSRGWGNTSWRVPRYRRFRKETPQGQRRLDTTPSGIRVIKISTFGESIFPHIALNTPLHKMKLFTKQDEAMQTQHSPGGPTNDYKSHQEPTILMYKVPKVYLVQSAFKERWCYWSVPGRKW